MPRPTIENTENELRSTSASEMRTSTNALRNCCTHSNEATAEDDLAAVSTLGGSTISIARFSST